ncbi:MAG TPA: DinB family protein [Gemmatimonadaceae bacterium]|nr:DinB family protein [Gemmatimonadaceae bacterium]
MSELERITDQLHRMYHGDAWHGPSLTEALDGVTVAQAAARPLHGGHTIHELTHHVAAWIGEVHDRLLGKAPGNPADGDFPPPDEPVDGAAWERVRERLAARHAALMQVVARFDPGRLDDPVDPTKGRQSGTAGTFYALLHGLVQHNAYHAGQIAILRKGAPRP